MTSYCIGVGGLVDVDLVCSLPHSCFKLLKEKQHDDHSSGPALSTYDKHVSVLVLK